MTEKQQEIITQLLSYLEQAAKTAADVTQAELPALLREIIALGAFEGVMWLVSGGVFLALNLWMRHLRATIPEAYSTSEFRGFLLVARCFTFGLAGVCLCIGVARLGMIYFAPRYYLLHEIMGFVK